MSGPKDYIGLDLAVATLSAYDDDDFPGVQHDAFGKGGTPPYEQHSPHGFLSRPLDPDLDAKGQPKLGCQVLIGMEGGRGHAWLSHDPRVIPKLPRLLKGESMVYGPAGNFIRCHADGTHTQFTTDKGGDASGQSVYSQTAPDKFLKVAPWGVERFDASGWHVLTHSGARIDCGGIGGLPAPLDAIGAYFSVSAPMVRFDCASAVFGGDAAIPLTKADPLIAILTDIVTALAQIVAIAGTPGTGSSPISANPTLTADMVALNALMASAKATLSSIVSGA